MSIHKTPPLFTATPWSGQAADHAGRNGAIAAPAFSRPGAHWSLALRAPGRFQISNPSGMIGTQRDLAGTRLDEQARVAQCKVPDQIVRMTMVK